MEDPIINNNHSLINFSNHTSPLQNNGINYSSDVDIELIAFPGKNYTSMKDLLLSSPPSVASPASNGSWQEIPIKDPLVQHAAWAYLQPIVVEARDVDDRWWRRLERKCCWLFSCFNDVVLVVFNGWFVHDDDDIISKVS